MFAFLRSAPATLTGVVAIPICTIAAFVGLLLAATGNITLLVAAFYYPAGAIFVIANSFRLVRFAEDFSAHEHPHGQESRPPAAARPATA